MKKIVKILTCVVVLLMAAVTVVSASTPYTTYTYSINGEVLESPDAYVPDPGGRIDAQTIGLDKIFGADSPDRVFDIVTDIQTDGEGKIYIADKNNNRIVILNSDGSYHGMIREFVNDQGVPDSLRQPQGSFIVDDGEYAGIYVCDTANARIVVFNNDENYSMQRVILAPESDLFDSDSKYTPTALAVDIYGRLFVVSPATYQGVISMTAEGVFISFIGAQKVSLTALEILQRAFMTDEQRAVANKAVSRPYNNIALDEGGEFVFVTTSSIDEDDQFTAIESKDSNFSPVKRLNAKGTDIMNRHGFFSPAGEVDVTLNMTTMIADASNAKTGVSKIVDVATGPSGTWSIIDEKRSKVYTYDSDGDLLFIFGDVGNQLGNIQLEGAASITYQKVWNNSSNQYDYNILVLDSKTSCITVYSRTTYGDLLLKAIECQNDRDYDGAIEIWEQVLMRNNNFDAAYVAIGKAYYRSGQPEKAMEMYKNAYDTEHYSDAFKEVRKQFAEKIIWAIPIIVVVVCFLLVKFFKYAGKVNKDAQLKVGRKSFKEEWFYGFHLIFHPFDGYWDLKHEKRGSVRVSFVYLATAIIAFYYQAIGTSYMFNPVGSKASIFSQIPEILLPVFLWVIANWCLTTLFEGEGSFKDIFIATSYATVPLPLLLIPSVLLTNVLTVEEGQLVTLLAAIAYIWTGFLLFFGMSVTHDYRMLKNAVTCIATLVGMVVVMFIAMLFITLGSKMVSFVTALVDEISYR